MIIMPSESAEYLVGSSAPSFRWDFWKLEEEGKLAVVDVTDPVLRLQKSIETDPVEFLINFRKLVDKKVREDKPQRVLIDDLMAFFTAVESPFVMRSLADDLFGDLRSPSGDGGDHHRRGLRDDPDHGVRGRLLHHPQEGRGSETTWSARSTS